MCDDNEPYKNLAYAIVENAVEEYKSLLRHLDSHEASVELRVRELERFFLSEWCKLLCGIDGRKIIESTRESLNVAILPHF